MNNSPVVPSIPLAQDGKYHGVLRLPHSRDDSAWGNVTVPITVVRNGNGPVALLTGANHGDEYEGPVALQDLAFTLDPDNISGTVIIVPAFNYPAYLAGTRTSPIDNGNMNRLFPGKPDGTVTEKIADYFQRTLIPMADIVLDFHSGGKTLDFVPFAASHVLNNKQQEASCVAAVKAFNAPYSVKLLEIDNVGMYDTAVEEQGKIFLSTELGGGGSSSARTVAIAKKGVRNVLVHAGILDGELQLEQTITLDMPDNDCFIFSEHNGLLETVVDLGQSVSVGDELARVWSTERNGQAPVAYHAKRSGILCGRHFPGLVKSGDCMAMVAVKV